MPYQKEFLKMKRILALILSLVVILSFAACAPQKSAEELSGSNPNALASAKIVAEAGSAGEDLVKGNAAFANAEFTAVDSMATALLEVASGTADGAVVDKITAIGSIGPGTSYTDLVVVDGYSFNPEEYGIAFRKGSDITPAVDAAIAELMADGTMDTIAAKYNLSEQLIKDGKSQTDTYSSGDLAYVQGKGELIIGITLFAPMNYEDANGELIGFETEFAKAVCAKLGVTPKFQIINWGSKEIELQSKNIDCIWNGMTIDEDRLKNMSISAPYMKNEQVLVAKNK